jgi:hypothetical protein
VGGKDDRDREVEQRQKRQTRPLPLRVELVPGGQTQSAVLVPDHGIGEDDGSRSLEPERESGCGVTQRARSARMSSNIR